MLPMPLVINTIFQLNQSQLFKTLVIIFPNTQVMLCPCNFQHSLHCPFYEVV